MALRVVTAPIEEPLSLDETKLYLRVDNTDEDDLISGLIIAAREYCQSFQNRAYITQTLELTLDHFPGSHYRPLETQIPFYVTSGSMSRDSYRHHRHDIRLALPPIQSVTSIIYTDDTGLATTLDPSMYIVDTDSEPGRIVPAYGQTWPTVQLQPINGVRVRYVAGYGDDSRTVPTAVKQAMRMLVAHWYENREAVVIMGSRSVGTPLDLAVKALLNTERVVPT